MAKKFVRGITDIKNIEHQDLDTNNVNDLLSDGKHNYIHRKKSDGSEEYHNLTNNIKTIQSDDTDLVSVTNYNNTTNSATIRPKHDSQKEQVLESTDETIVISHGENGTDETTSVDVNPEKVLEHDNLLTSYGISKTKSGNTLNLGIEYTKVQNSFDLNTLTDGRVRGYNMTNAPQASSWFLVSAFSEGQYTIQDAITLTYDNNKTYRRLKTQSGWGNWREQTGDKSAIDSLLAKKEQLLESTDDTILISHGENGTDETTSVDVNPEIVLEHENLLTGDGLNIVKNGNKSTITLESTNKPSSTVLSTLNNSVIYGTNFPDGSEQNVEGGYITLKISSDKKIQIYTRESTTTAGLALMTYRYVTSTGSTEWREMTIDSNRLNLLLAQKQNTLTSNTSIGISGTGLMQLYSYKMSYSKPLEGSLNTYAKTVQKATQLTADPKIEYHFTAKLNDGIAGMSVDLEDDDVTYFTTILDSYGQTSASGKRAMINGLIFTLNGSQLTVSRDVSSTAYNQVVSFSDIIDPSVSVQSSNQEQTE